MWSMSRQPRRASRRQESIAIVGRPAQCLIRRKRSSSAAARSFPSTIRHAAESPWKALRPRMEGIRAERTEDREQKTAGNGRRTEDRAERTEDREQRTADRDKA